MDVKRKVADMEFPKNVQTDLLKLIQAKYREKLKSYKNNIVVI
jgi:hypothetical protein